MDFSSLKDQVSNLTLYDLKAGVRKVQNAVMNYTDMEAKVREATNNEPWGASSTLMQEIANATFSYQSLNEVMPMIYKRFTEKSAEEWRQIYKALQLLEFLIKNGSERVIDDARSHLSLLKMLRQFHYIDQNGKDQGINVRNRSKELAELLGDVERIRAERKKARTTRNKYGGVEGGAGLGPSSSSGRYGGFGSDTAGYGVQQGDYGGYSGGVYGDGGGFGGNESGYGDTQARRDKFEEYDEYDEGAVAAPGKRQGDARQTSTGKREAKKVEKPAPPVPKAPEVDLFSFDDPMPAPASSSNGNASAMAPTSAFGALQAPSAAEDDDFDDFQSATPSTQTAQPTQSAAAFNLQASPASTISPVNQFNATQPRTGVPPSNMSSLFTPIAPASAGAPSSLLGNAPSSSLMSTPLMTSSGGPSLMSSASTTSPTGYAPSGPNYYQSVQAGLTPGAPVTGIASLGAQKPKAAGGDAFASLLGGSKKVTAKTGNAPSMAAMAKQQTSASLWGAPASNGSAASPAPLSKPSGGTGSAAMDDLLG